MNGLALRRAWLEHGLPLVAYAALALALSWPTAQHFTTGITSDGGDARHHLWHLWHLRQVVLGQQPLFSTDLLYYPVGASLLTHSLGPLLGVLALPFWAWGPEAAYNGALLASACLTGYGMYLLARGLGFERDVALFAGVVLVAAPIRLGGTSGTLTRVFLGLLPLVLLALHRALSPERRAWWALGTAVLLLLTLLYNGFNFVYTGLSIAFFFAAILRSAPRAQRPLLLRRAALLAVGALVLVGPLVLAMLTAGRDPRLAVEADRQSRYDAPDLVQLFVPSSRSQLYGLVEPLLAGFDPNWLDYYEPFVPWTVMALGVLAVLSGGGPARRWALFGALGVLLALGPSLRVFGQSRFTDYELPIMLPYALLVSLPGLEFMRVPARSLQMAFVGLSIAASFGLVSLARRWPGRRTALVVVATGLVLLETWPRPWAEERLRPAPAFYQQLAADPEQYGVLDLPVRPQKFKEPYASYYQLFQLTHGKGIAWGYLSRTHLSHPLFPCLVASDTDRPDVLVDGRTVDCYADMQARLAREGYRYVVWHKAQPGDVDFHPSSPEVRAAQAFVEAVFAQQPPLADDGRATVYAVAPSGSAPPRTRLELADNWQAQQRTAKRRWMKSPATLLISSPREQQVELRITPEAIHDPRSRDGLGKRGVLKVEFGDGPAATLDLASGQTSSLPLSLVPGRQTVTLTLEAGNFRPDGGREPLVAFAIRSIELQTGAGAAR